MRTSSTAYLKTKGKLGYRDCEISYYTYNMADLPNKFKVNVNVCLQCTKTQSIKSLAIDDDFERDEEAINYGIEQGKKFIDQSYASGKISVINIEKPKPPANDKVGSNNKKESKKTQS